MNLKPPSDENLVIRTSRLILEPVKVEHASEMVSILSSPQLYNFVPQNPPDIEKLKKTYELWSKRISPEGDEIWLNWVARGNDNNQLVGHFQVGQKPKECSIAYTVGLDFQRLGFAKEALLGIFSFLKVKMDTKIVKAWIDTRNAPSIELVKKLNMSQVSFISKADYFKGTDSDEYVFQKFL